MNDRIYWAYRVLLGGYSIVRYQGSFCWYHDRMCGLSLSAIQDTYYQFIYRYLNKEEIHESRLG
jgi:hypothetical protein